MKQKKKNGFFTFLCSFLPGAAEMYMGFMRTGLSLMTVFFLCIILPALFGGSDVFLGFAFIAYAYSFFHARNLWALNDEEFAEAEDDYVWSHFQLRKAIPVSSESAGKWIAWLLILAGCSLLWNNVRDLMYEVLPKRFIYEPLFRAVSALIDKAPGIVLAVLVIFLGVRMIRGKKAQLLLAEKEANEPSHES